MENKIFSLKSISLFCVLFCMIIGKSAFSATDTIVIHNVGHGSLYFEYKELIIHVDPYSSQADYAALPDANLIFITHGHSDHYDLSALGKIKTEATELVCTQAVKNLGTYTGATHVLNNGDSMLIKGIWAKAVPAYNVVNTSYHPKGVGNGYIFTFGEKRIYVGGDTENIPEMSTFGKIDIAFIPMNLPYTMTVAAAAEAAKKINPDILYVYHFGTSDTASLRNMLSDQDMTIRMGKSVHSESALRENPSSVRPNSGPDTGFYPNPVQDYLTIYNLNSGSSVSLFDITGRLLLKKYHQNEGEHRMDLKSLIPGVYILNYQDKQQVKSSLVFKE